MTKNPKHLVPILWLLVSYQTFRLAFRLTGWPNLVLSLVFLVAMVFTVVYQMKATNQKGRA